MVILVVGTEAEVTVTDARVDVTEVAALVDSTARLTEVGAPEAVASLVMHAAVVVEGCDSQHLRRTYTALLLCT
eukprot:1681000-Pleurochrysis_carterae.AAC.1